MKTAKWIALGAAVLSAAMCLLYLIPRDIALPSDTASIGIIGGADGPTAVFVNTSPAPWYIMPAVFVVALCAWLFFRYKSKK